MGKRCIVKGCRKLSHTADPNYISLCKKHICRCKTRCCKIHDDKGNWIKDLELNDGRIIIGFNKYTDEFIFKEDK